MTDFEKIRRWLALLPFDGDPWKGDLPTEGAYGMSSLILVTDSYSPELEAAIAGAEARFSAVTLVLVGDEGRDTGLIPTIRLPLGCDVAAELVALD